MQLLSFILLYFLHWKKWSPYTSISWLQAHMMPGSMIGRWSFLLSISWKYGLGRQRSANHWEVLRRTSLVWCAMMDGNAEARKQGAEAQKDAYCHLLWAWVKSWSRVQRAWVFTKSSTGFIIPWIWSKDSNWGARERKAIAYGFVAVDKVDKLDARAGGGQIRDSVFWRENPSREWHMAPEKGMTKEVTAQTEKSWKPRPPNDIGKCAICQGWVPDDTSLILCPETWAKKAAVDDWSKSRNGEVQWYGSKSSCREGKWSKISIGSRSRIDGRMHFENKVIFVCKSFSWFWMAFHWANVKLLGCIGQGSLNVIWVANRGTEIHNSILQVVGGL